MKQETSNGAVETIKTYCILCAMRCPVKCDVEKGEIRRVQPDFDHPLGGPFCPKGAAARDLVSDPARLKYPMKRTNPKGSPDPGWVRISWDEAMTTMAEQLNRVRAQHGAEAVAFYRPAPGGSPSRDFNPWMMRLAHAYGSPNLASTTHICNWHKDSGSAYTYGTGLPEADYESSRCIIIWGTNPHATGVRHVAPIKQAVERGAKLIVIDPRRIPLAINATQWLRVRPAADLPLALGLIHQIINKALHNADFLRTWTNAPFLLRADNNGLLTEADLAAGGSNSKYVIWNEVGASTAIYDPAMATCSSDSTTPALEGSWPITLADGKVVTCSTVFTGLRRSVAQWTPEATERATGIPAEKIVATAEIIGSTHPVSYYSYNGIEQHADAMQINRAICILYALTGDFDSEGGVVVYPALPAKPIAGFNLLPKQSKKRIGVERRPLGPSKEGHVQAYAIYQAIIESNPYPVKALVSFGGNLIVSNGDTKTGAEALKQLEFYAHMDFYENPTAKFADLLLPAASSWESEAVGLYNWREKGHVQLRRVVVAPEYERQPDIEVIFDLAVRLGLGNLFFNGDIKAAFDELLSPLGLTVDELRAEPTGIPVQLEPTYRKYAAIDQSTGRPRGFNTPSRLLEIYSLTFAANGYAPFPEYYPTPRPDVDPSHFPLILTAGKPGAYTHGSYRSLPMLRRLEPEPKLEINPATAQARSVRDGDWVTLETPMGHIRAKAAYRDDVHPDVVVGQEGWWQGCEALGLPGYDPFSEAGSNLNLVTSNAVIDPITGSVPHRGQPCEVRLLT